MDRLFWFSLLLTYLPVTESMEEAEGCLSQPNEVIWQKTGASVVLPCTASSQCSSKGFQYEWLVFKEDLYLRLNLSESPSKYILDGGSLHIKSLNANDSGIYHCAAVSHGVQAPGSQHVGFGTTLVVNEKIKMMVRHILLWLSFVLLAIYSVAIVTLIIKKYGCNMGASRRMPKIKKNNSSKRTQFHDVLQEMYNKRNKQTVSRNHQAQAASTEFNSSTDDIYQNV